MGIPLHNSIHSTLESRWVQWIHTKERSHKPRCRPAFIYIYIIGIFGLVGISFSRPFYDSFQFYCMLWVCESQVAFYEDNVPITYCNHQPIFIFISHSKWKQEKAWILSSSPSGNISFQITFLFFLFFYFINKIYFTLAIDKFCI